MQPIDRLKAREGRESCWRTLTSLKQGEPGQIGTRKSLNRGLSPPSIQARTRLLLSTPPRSQNSCKPNSISPNTRKIQGSKNSTSPSKTLLIREISSMLEQLPRTLLWEPQMGATFMKQSNLLRMSRTVALPSRGSNRYKGRARTSGRRPSTRTSQPSKKCLWLKTPLPPPALTEATPGMFSRRFLLSTLGRVLSSKPTASIWGRT